MLAINNHMSFINLNPYNVCICYIYTLTVILLIIYTRIYIILHCGMNNLNTIWTSSMSWGNKVKANPNFFI